MSEPAWPPSLRPGQPNGPGRVALLAAVAGVTLAGVGFVAGTRATGSFVERLRVQPQPRAVTSGAVPRYQDMGKASRGPNQDLYRAGLSALVATRPDPFAPVVQTPEEREALLEARRSRRAYDGAPPTIPHAIDERSNVSCLSCHGTGVRIGDKVAPLIPHEALPSCTQCHVPMRSDQSPPTTFVGVASPGPGARAWTGAPPTIPHDTRMRSECQSCHGPGGLHGIRTPHPYRESCTQCHVTQTAPPQMASP